MLKSSHFGAYVIWFTAFCASLCSLPKNKNFPVTLFCLIYGKHCICSKTVILLYATIRYQDEWGLLLLFLWVFFNHPRNFTVPWSCPPAGHLRDPNNQIVMVKGLRISVTGVNTRPAQPTELHRFLSQAVSACQPPDGPAANVITAGDYDLNISGESV